jgi:hypothetical protein
LTEPARKHVASIDDLPTGELDTTWLESSRLVGCPNALPGRTPVAHRPGQHQRPIELVKVCCVQWHWFLLRSAKVTGQVEE